MRTLYVALEVLKFKCEVVGSPVPVKIDIDPGGMIGYLPVYASREALSKDYLAAHILEIEEINSTPYQIRERFSSPADTSPPTSR
jgi:hypothetical protein